MTKIVLSKNEITIAIRDYLESQQRYTSLIKVSEKMGWSVNIKGQDMEFIVELSEKNTTE